mmetsp:Transcript_8115/g.25817  ORF Transcript_8115/g.25817 Transcript_8115/m.25817 type:complete len:332 (+) Transcript_8115:1-996(+)
MDEIEALCDGPSVWPTGSRQRAVAALLELFGDEGPLKQAAMHFRWNFAEQEAFLKHEFGVATGLEGPALERAMKRFAGSLPVLGVSPEISQGVEASYWRFIRALDEHLAAGHAFLLGDAPCAGDFGLIGPLYAHLLRDPVPGFLLRTRFPRVAQYVERVMGADQVYQRPAVNGAGWLPDDAIPSTLIPLVAQALEEHWPVLQSTLHAVVQRTRAPGADLTKELPRAVGSGEFVIGGCTGRRAFFAFDAWKLQRLVDKLDATSRAWLGSVFGPRGSELAALDMRSHICLEKRPGPNRASTIYVVPSNSSASNTVQNRGGVHPGKTLVEQSKL